MVFGFVFFGMVYCIFCVMWDWIILICEGLILSIGEEIMLLDVIKKVECGVFVLKLFNGFMFIVYLKVEIVCWVSGFWWCLGCCVGVGGVVSGY